MRESENETGTAPTLPPGPSIEVTTCLHPSPNAVSVKQFEFLSPPENPDEIGRLGGHRILDVLGQGGMGVVFLAEDVKLRRRFALKVTLPEAANKPTAKARFLREAQAAAKLEHDHVVPILHLGEDRGVLFFAMPLLKGQTLEALLRTNPLLPLNEVLRIGQEMARGLAAAHDAGLIHRDVKPSNVWLESPINRVKLLDFGLVLSTEESESTELTNSGMILGTPAYLAPEQARSEPVDHRADLFSLGVVLYRLCTGTLPFRGKDRLSMLASSALDHPLPPHSVNPSVPPALSELVMRLLNKDPSQRPASAHEVETLLRQVNLPVTSSWTRPRHGYWLLAMVGMVSLAIVLFATLRPWLLATNVPKEEVTPPPTTTKPDEPRVIHASPFERLRHEEVSPAIIQMLGGKMAVPDLVGAVGSTDPDSEENVLDFTISPDGKLLATNHKNNEVRIREVPTWKVIQRLDRRGEFQKHGMRFSPDGKWFAMLDRSDQGPNVKGRLRTFRVADWEPQQTFYIATQLYLGWKFAFSPNSRFLAFGALDLPVQVFHLEGQWKQVPLERPLPCRDVLFLDDEKLLTWHPDPEVIPLFRRWNVTTGKRLEDLTRSPAKRLKGIQPIVLIPPGKHLVYGQGYSNTLSLFDLATSQEKVLDTPEPFEKAGTSSRTPAASPDGKWLAALTSSGRVALWDTAKFEPRPFLDLAGYQRSHPAQVQPFAFTPDSRHLCLIYRGEQEGVEKVAKSPGPLLIFRLPWK